ncbi:MAG: FAD-dependent oxidoreductase [Candidatus Omnitrophica bacterium]|nr:FAD-dependent oxidoreductase [Candidatus Omnitrophota bacterium]
MDKASWYSAFSDISPSAFASWIFWEISARAPFLFSSSIEESTFLTKFASKVYLIHRRDQLRASKIMQQRVINHPKIQILWNTIMIDVLGEDAVSGVRIKDVKTGQERDLACGGLFYAIGFTPNTALLTGQLAMDDMGYLITTPGSTQTSVHGVFACGDVQDKRYRQAITAAGSGCMAALDCERWLIENKGVAGVRPSATKRSKFHIEGLTPISDIF